MKIKIGLTFKSILLHIVFYISVSFTITLDLRFLELNIKIALYEMVLSACRVVLVGLNGGNSLLRIWHL